MPGVLSIVADQVFSGGGIDYAVAPDGSHYRDLKTAFLYRKQLISNCTCNGKTPFGLARMDIKDDPTLARGDMVATKDGLMAVVGRNQNGPQFAKVDESRLSPPRDRGQVADNPNRRSRSVSRGARRKPPDRRPKINDCGISSAAAPPVLTLSFDAA